MIEALMRCDGCGRRFRELRSRSDGDFCPNCWERGDLVIEDEEQQIEEEPSEARK